MSDAPETLESLELEAGPPGAPAPRRHRSLLHAIVTVGVLGGVARLALVARELIVAHELGTAPALSAFLIALAVPAFVTAVIGGSLNAAFIPVYIDVRHREGRVAAARLFSNVLTLGAAVTLALTALLYALGPLIIGALCARALAGEADLALALYVRLLPLLPLSAMTTTAAAVLNAEDHFTASSLVPLTTPLAVIAAVLLAPSAGQVHALALGTVAGAAVEAGLLGLALWRHGLPLVPTFDGLPTPVRAVLGQYGPTAAGALIMSGSPLVDQAFATSLGGDSVAVLGYGGKIVSLIVGTVAVALGTAVLPRFSRMVIAGDFAGLRQLVRRLSLIVAGAAVPVTLVLIVYSPALVRLLFERGAFGAADTAVVASAQRAFLVQVPFYLLGIPLVRILSALGAGRFIFVIGVTNFVLNGVLDWLLMRLLGVTGIALATSAVYVGSFTACLVAVNVLIGRRGLGARGA